jgi:hypothetical protein
MSIGGMTDREKLKYSKTNVPLYHFVKQKSHMDSPGNEPRLPWRKNQVS